MNILVSQFISCLIPGLLACISLFLSTGTFAAKSEHDPVSKRFAVITTVDIEPGKSGLCLEEMQRHVSAYTVRQPGFISANFHIRLDNSQIMVYTEWRSEREYITHQDDQRDVSKDKSGACGKYQSSEYYRRVSILAGDVSLRFSGTGTSLNPERQYIVLVRSETAQEEAEQHITQVANFITDFVRKQPGFMSGNLHLRTDNKEFLNYTEWGSEEEYDAFLQKMLDSRSLQERVSREVPVWHKYYRTSRIIAQ